MSHEAGKKDVMEARKTTRKLTGMATRVGMAFDLVVLVYVDHGDLYEWLL